MPSSRTCPATRLGAGAGAGGAACVALPHEGQYAWVSFNEVPHRSQNIFGLPEASSHYHTPSIDFLFRRQVEMLARICCHGSDEDPCRRNSRVGGAEPALRRRFAGYPSALYRGPSRIPSRSAKLHEPGGGKR